MPTDPKRIEGIEEALTEADYRWHLFTHAKTPLDQAHALTQFANAFSDLRTWHQGYDADHGTLPWERETDA